MLCVSELFRRHPINKAGTARAKQGKFLMLTMTYNLVQKGVIHSVTVMGGKSYLCVALGSRGSVTREGGLQAGWPQGISVLAAQPKSRLQAGWAQSKGCAFWSLLVCAE